MRDLVSSGITMLTPLAPTSTSTLLSPTPPPAAIALQRDSDPLTPSDPLNLSYPASPKPVLVDIVPTDPPLSSHSPIALSNFSPSFLEFRHSITVITAHSPSPGPISSTEDDDNLKLNSCKEKDSIESPSVDREKHANTITAKLDFPPHLSSVTDPGVATAGRSLRESNSECTGDHPPHPSHCPYDMV
ncbi:hypothetical protein EDB83DRAFT_2452408 [Lactarius deliciosus]|nr:hypothetical protein EDB83DRAFT_2452408 [Lactarius deliciosus]